MPRGVGGRRQRCGLRFPARDPSVALFSPANTFPVCGKWTCVTRTNERTTGLGVADSRVFHFHTTRVSGKKCVRDEVPTCSFRVHESSFHFRCCRVSFTATLLVYTAFHSPAAICHRSRLPPAPPSVLTAPPTVDGPGHLVDLLRVELIKAATWPMPRDCHTSQ